MRNSILIARVSSLAITAALTAAASAQSFLGDHNVAFGSVNVLHGTDINGKGTTDLFVDTQTAVIDWTPDDNAVGGGAIDFQPADTTATFFGSPGLAVLNRINVADQGRAIALNGTINSIVSESTGGNIFFYSPSGFVVGSSAAINVGSLVLSASPIAVDGNGGFVNGTTVTFNQAPNPSAAISTLAGSQISALNEGSYVAMLAPRVDHRGNIAVNGGAALVGAEAATITFSPNGLFDIQIDVGTTDPNGVVHTGSTGGPSSTGSGDNHRVYMVAVPKNEVLTMLLSGNVGFEAATEAGVENGVVVLRSGWDSVIFGGTIDALDNPSPIQSNLILGPGNYTSNVSGQVTGDAFAIADTGSLNFAGDLSLANTEAAGSARVHVGATSGHSITVSGNLWLDSRATQSISEVLLYAQDGSSITVGGFTRLISFDDSGGLGGLVQMFADNGSIDIAGETEIFAVGLISGTDSATPRSAVGGTIDVWAENGGSITTANLSADVSATGQRAFLGGPAGSGTGGSIFINARSAGQVSINGNLNANADGSGGEPGAAGLDAGNGTGGLVSIGTQGDGAAFAVAGTTFASANGFGGHGDGSSNECFSCNGLGGTGLGGIIRVGTETGTGSTAFFGDLVELFAEGTGGSSALAGSPSAAGSGGSIDISANGGGRIEGFGLHFASDVNASASGLGGESFTSGIAAGAGNGGFVTIIAGANSTLGIGGDLVVDADGFGGFNDFGVDGGDGTGGTITVSSQNDNASISVTGIADLEADGESSVAGSDCTACGGGGGDGFGGIVQIFNGIGTNNVIAFATSLDLSAEGYGGIGVTGAAGQGEGGVAFISVGTGLTFTVGTTLTIEGDGYGGYAFNGNSAGDGIGGVASLAADGGILDVDGSAFLDAGGLGGSTGISAGGIGGDGEGGTAQFIANGGTIDIAGSLFVEAVGEGGDSVGGTGGNGLGGSALVGAEGGTIHVRTNAFLDGSAIGGDGDTGGNATARVSDPADELQPIAATIYAAENGSIQVDGIASLTAEAAGGNGGNGNGGNAEAGEADVVAYVADITLGTLAIDVSGRGGNGGNGGAGGNAFGGVVDVTFGFDDAAVGGTITLGSATILADGFGGSGGNGAGGNSGADGGIGGNGEGGFIIFAGSAAGGTLDSGAAIITARGEGGAGGNGGAGDTGTGGNGGAGGTGTGGFIQTGTISSELAPTSGGGAVYTTLAVDTSGLGGQGGNGGLSPGGNGAGGDGGDAFGGQSNFLARGVLVTADTVDLFADATGGDGGAGSIQGDGGDAATGFLAVESKDRFDHPEERGTLDAGIITGTAVAVGGTGATSGVSTLRGGSYFRVLNGDATIDSVSLTIGGELYDGTDGPDLVSVRDGTATIAGDFSYSTTGELALDANNGSMAADTITLSAGSFVPDSFNPAPTITGSYSANAFDIATGGDFITNANLISTAPLTIDAPGLIDMAGATSGGNLIVTAGSTIDAGTLAGAGFVGATAPGSISLNLAQAGTDIDILSASGDINSNGMAAGGGVSLDAGGAISVGPLTAANDIFALSGGSLSTGAATSTGGNILLESGDTLSTGALSAPGWIFLDAIGDISFGDAEGDEVEFDGGGSVTGGDIVAGTQVYGEAAGPVTLGDVSVGIQRTGGAAEDGFAVGLVSATSIDVGNVEADEAIGFATLGTLNTGNLTAGPGVMALASGDMGFGSIATAPDGRVYLADAQMFLDAGGPENFDPTLVLGADPVATSGSINIGGPVTTGWLQAAAGNDFSALGISAASDIDVSAGGAISVNGAWNSGGDVELVSNDLDIGASGSISGGELNLVSTNATQTVVGDGIAGGGYQLSEAEFNRLDSNDIDIIADSGLGAAARILIGNLDVNAPGGRGNDYEFVTLGSEGDVVGSIRILGEAVFTGMDADDAVTFTTNRFELDAATGVLSLENAPDTLGGTLFLDAANIHVASGEILDQLAENPQYEGYQDDLNAPAAVQRPDSVIRAGSIEIEFGDGGESPLNTLYVQNSGTADLPAGFLVGEAVLFGEGGETTPPPGSIDVIINGQIVTESGTLTGVEVRDALVEAEGDLTPFTGDSTINGCLLAGPCGVEEPESPFPPGFTPLPGLPEEFELFDDNQLPLPDFGNEDFIDDNDEETDADSPIQPPKPLFDTSELGDVGGTVEPEVGTSMRSNPGLTDTGDVDDPVSGSGNPGLMETTPPSSNQEKQP